MNEYSWVEGLDSPPEVSVFVHDKEVTANTVYVDGKEVSASDIDPYTGEIQDDITDADIRPVSSSAEKISSFAHKAITSMNEGDRVSHSTMNHALTFMHDIGEPNARPEHGYDFSGFDQSELIYLHSFGNAMHKAGVSQEEVQGLLRWYLDWESGKKATAISQGVSDGNLEPLSEKEHAALDEKDRASTASVMRKAWGIEYHPNIRLINDYLDRLPDSDRIAIESATLPDGSLKLNDPETLKDLARKARTSIGLTRKGKPGEREEIEQFMRTNRKAYNKDQMMQVRYRELLSQGDTEAPMPTSHTGIDAEIIRIEQFMKENRKAYNKDDKLQARYRELLTLKHR